MDAKAALKFAYDWPAIPGLPLLCNLCGRPVRKRRALAHADSAHPGWLEEWNAALKDLPEPGV